MHAKEVEGHSARFWKFLAIALGVILLLVVVVFGSWLWINRPIEPTILSSQELEEIEQKVEALQEPGRGYQAGSKEISLSEDELNGYLHHYTQLGEQLALKLEEGEIHARLQTVLDEGFPIFGGRRLTGRAQITAGFEEGRPSLIVQDVTLYGVSLPGAWLADMKGKNLLAELSPEDQAHPLVRGIQDIKILPGQLLVTLTE